MSVHAWRTPGTFAKCRRAGFSAALLGSLAIGGVAQAGSESTVYDFTKNGNVGSSPAGNILALGETLYGTNYDSSARTGGGGTVYRITKLGHHKLLHNFVNDAGDDSVQPATLINVGGTFYGSTGQGGGTGCQGPGCGVIYSLTPGGMYKVLYTFQGLGDGYYANSLVYLDGMFYGTTGDYPGSVFSMTPQGVLKTLYTFQRGTDGEAVNGIIAVDGVLYGSTIYGGSGTGCSKHYGCGTIFSVTLQGVKSTLYQFRNHIDGNAPTGRLVNMGDELYGVTSKGGSAGVGNVFRVDFAGHHETLHEFSQSQTDGAFPSGGLTRIGTTLYGLTSEGGSGNYGTIFSVSTHGAESVVYSFDDTSGSFPYRTMIDLHGALYGTSSGGGTAGLGLLFKVTP